MLLQLQIVHCVHILTDSPIAESYKFLWIVISCVCAVKLQLSILWVTQSLRWWFKKKNRNDLRVWMKKGRKWVWSNETERSNVLMYARRPSFISRYIFASFIPWVTLYFGARFMWFWWLFCVCVFFCVLDDIFCAQFFSLSLLPTFNHLTILLLYSITQIFHQ